MVVFVGTLNVWNKAILDFMSFIVSILVLVDAIICIYIIRTKCEPASPTFEMEIKIEVKDEGTGSILKPKQEIDVKHEIVRRRTWFILKTKKVITKLGVMFWCFVSICKLMNCR